MKTLLKRSLGAFVVAGGAMILALWIVTSIAETFNRPDPQQEEPLLGRTWAEHCAQGGEGGPCE